MDITLSVIEKVLNKKIQKFLKSDAPQSQKKFISNLDIIIYINNKMTKAFGFANILPVTPAVMRKYKIKNRNCFKIDEIFSYAILELCPKSIHTGTMDTFAELEETISHELAHFIEMRKNGSPENRKCDTYHNKTWQHAAIRFGCKYIDYKG